MSASSTGDSTGDLTGTAERTSGWTRLTTGTGNVDVVGRRKLWYILFAVLIVVSVLSIGIRGFNLGIDFTGGSQIQMPGTGASGQITGDNDKALVGFLDGFAKSFA